MPATAILTSEQYLSLPEEFDQNGNRIKDELIGGQIVKMPPPSRKHDLIKNRIGRILNRFFDANPHLRMESLVEMAAEISKHDAFVPDVSVYQEDRLTGSEGRIQRGAPDLAIEVASPTDTAKHLRSKAVAYLHGGSKSVWVVFPDSRSVMIYAGNSIRELKADQTIEDALLPGFSALVSSFFERT
jgi:Uma2 family endonuclease